MVKKQESSTPAAGGTPWKGRLRSHHATPVSSPSPWIQSRSRNRDEDAEAGKFKKQAAPTARGRSGCTRDESGGAAGRPPKALPRRSARFAGRDPEPPIVLDAADEECKVRDNQSAIVPLQKSTRFQRGDKSVSKPLVENQSHHRLLPFTPNPRDIAHNSKTRNAVKKDKKLENPPRSSQRISAVKASARMGKHKLQTVYEDSQDAPARKKTADAYYKKSEMQEPNPRDIAHNSKTRNAVKKDKKLENPPRSSQRISAVKASARMGKHKLQTVYEDSQDAPARKKTADASYKKSEMQEPKPPSRGEDLTGKRKRGTGRKQASKKQTHQEHKSDCQEIVPITEPQNIIHKKSENNPSSIVQPKIGDEELSGIKEGVQQQCCPSDEWTEEQDTILRQAYFTARPSPHFWKKVSKMVPGRSAEDCFNRVHADLSTPTPIAPRHRSKTQFSPLAHFTLSDPKFPNLVEPLTGRPRTAKQKSLLAQKTVRHLLKKHSLIDQAHEADHFSIFETSPSALQLNIPLEDSPGTPENYLKSFSMHKYSVSSSAHKRPLSRLKTKQTEESPAVLKPIKNTVLHEKYITQLSRREGAKKPRKKAAGTNATDPKRPLSEQQAGSVKAAKNALISEATDFIGQFKKLQANSLAHILENSEDDEDFSVSY
ncbi:hypothetical protein D1007_05973 [Hordeum vulgare]|uniref:Myb-like domain-containing protein n=1 Tax=Hordeum vulgare subsp. vulgare TaxID=112509 RepID=A0A8I6ZBU4_HORVV|nr:uncharacterized protein LOC123411487 isoform X1 [Hordeum vulgare subsp. vulgare]KAE8816627.1 hypothetical protein D1007_05973 [Hordeum vulgare]KAI4971903.1 hypothetical protein ZWY2020_002817 [Hordeum vulgare]